MPDPVDPPKVERGRRRAVALRYNASKEQAPRVVASGAGHIAGRILEVAREHGIAVHEDADLVQTLSALDLGMEIPEDVYRAVAEVLAFVYRLNKAQGASGR
jgi:flagellar biosynthesis protein